MSQMANVQSALRIRFAELLAGHIAPNDAGQGNLVEQLVQAAMSVQASSHPVYPASMAAGAHVPASLQPYLASALGQLSIHLPANLARFDLDALIDECREAEPYRKTLSPYIEQYASLRAGFSPSAVPLDPCEVAALALQSGWSCMPVSLYDEDGIEGWQWTSPYGHEFTVVGDWTMPTAGDDAALRTDVCANLGKVLVGQAALTSL